MNTISRFINNEDKMFYIVVIIDEMADLMLQTKSAIEDSVQRLAQMGRALGIHLVLCTQRPSPNVITGVIKANLPSRIALQVASAIDSRVVLDANGADTLLGKGDMLYIGISDSKPKRIQGSFISEKEITALTNFWRAQGGPDYPLQVLPDQAQNNGGSDEGLGTSSEEMLAALTLIMERRRVSQDLLKSHFHSSARATNLLSLLEVKGSIHKPEGTTKWEIHFYLIDIKPYFPCEDYAKQATDQAMIQTIQVNKIASKEHEISILGEIRNVGGSKFLQLSELPDHIGKYIKVLWWFHRFDDKKYRSVLMCDPPYKCEKKIGVFASRSPVRPNPVAITVVRVNKVDRDLNRIYISHIESYDHTPLLGMIDYDADTDRIDEVKVPEWAKDWPDCMDGQDTCDEATLENTIRTLDEKAKNVMESFHLDEEQIIQNEYALMREKPTHIEVIGARENNLKGIHVTIPYGKITAVVGVSGSGKSSLVMDTIYAECKRRMDILNSDNAGIVRPEMDEMLGCIPTVKISQNEIRSNLNSTIGTFSGLYGHLRSIYASIGTRNYKNSNQVEFKMTPTMFSYMDQECRCARCNGTGVVSEVDVQKVITDENKSLLEGASPFLGKLKTFIQNPNANWMKGQVIAIADELNVSLEPSWKNLPEHFKKIVL